MAQSTRAVSRTKAKKTPKGAVSSRAVPRITDVNQQMRNDERRWWGFFFTMLFITLLAAGLASVSVPKPLSLALVLLIATFVTAALRPVVGVYLLLFFTLVGDLVTTEWWPFTKNMSSQESILYINDGLILSPLEFLAGITLAAFLLQRLADPTWRFVRGRLFNPIALFTLFVIFGIGKGRASGGDSRVAIFEFRSMLYILVTYVLITNLITTRRQYRRLVWVSVVAISIQSVFSLQYYRTLPELERATLESLGEHPSSVQMDALFIFLLGLWLFKGRRWARWTMLLLAVPVTYAYMLAQRRAAMVALFAGIIVLVVVLYHRRRKAFWFFTPTVAVLGIGFIGATWNASGGLGLASTAVKTVLFPGQLAESDAGSDMYRQIETFDLWATIRASPFTGLGFGQKFHAPIGLPDLSFFEFYEYIPHNSVLWIWVKMGVFGFVTMLYLMARAVQLGIRSALNIRSEEQAVTVLVGLTYVIMFIVFAYVDIAWGSRSTVFLALAFALCADMEPAMDETANVAEGVHHGQLESVVR
ncbi:MAG: O-antigen ligase family protein [Ilumatobacteraceae bacterium]